jgi:hypothetical protein
LLNFELKKYNASYQARGWILLSKFRLQTSKDFPRCFSLSNSAAFSSQISSNLISTLQPQNPRFTSDPEPHLTTKFPCLRCLSLGKRIRRKKPDSFFTDSFQPPLSRSLPLTAFSLMTHNFLVVKGKAAVVGLCVDNGQGVIMITSFAVASSTERGKKSWKKKM